MSLQTVSWLLIGVFAAIADVVVNVFFRLPILEIAILAFLLIFSRRINLVWISFGGLLLVALLVSQLAAWKLTDLGLQSLRLVLLVTNMALLVANRSARETLVLLFAGMYAGLTLCAVCYLLLGEELQAKFVLPSVLTVAVLLYVYLDASRPRVGRFLMFFLLLWELVFSTSISFRQHYLILAVAALTIFLRRSILVIVARWMFMLPLFSLIAAFFFAQNLPDYLSGENATRSNVERTLLLSNSIASIVDAPLVGLDRTDFLNTVDDQLRGLNYDELEATSTHNFYADSLIFYGIPYCSLVVLISGIFCQFAARVIGATRFPRLAFVALYSVFSILSFTAVALYPRIELLASLFALTCCIPSPANRYQTSLLSSGGAEVSNV